MLTKKSIFCVGSQGIQSWWTAATDSVECALGVGFAKVNNTGYVLSLLHSKEAWPSGQVFENTDTDGSLKVLDNDRAGG